MRILFLIIGLFAASIATAQETVVSELSQDGVSITATFDGSEIFLFGAIKRDAPVSADAGKLDIIIEVSGPPTDTLVRRKDRKIIIWVNADSVEMDRAPSYYSIAATGPLEELVTESERSLRNLGLDYAVRVVNPEDEEYREAVIRIHQKDGTYASEITPVTLTEETLFTTKLAMPVNVVEGEYTVKTMLVRDQHVISTSTSTITVQKTGVEKWLYTLAHEQAFIYGLLSLAVALLAGWGASEIFRRIRG
ncbi:MAG: TIGR02186 family protein [Alphaproteobacteria bacterium]